MNTTLNMIITTATAKQLEHSISQATLLLIPPTWATLRTTYYNVYFPQIKWSGSGHDLRPCSAVCHV